MALFAKLAFVCGCSQQEDSEEWEQTTSIYDAFQLSAEAISRNGITLAQVTSHEMNEFVEAPAEVQLNPDRVADVVPLVAGQVLSVHLKVGDQVKAGQTLFTLRSVEIGQARAEYRQAEAMLEVAQANFQRQKSLRDEGISSERSFLEAQFQKAEAEAELDAAQARLLVFGQSGGNGPDLPVRTPISGTIIERHVTTGENVGPDDDLFVIADTSSVWILAHVYEQDMGKVSRGSTAHLTLQAQPGRSWEGQISYVAPVVDESTRTLEVRMELANENGSLRPGLFGRLQIAATDSRQALAIPWEAVQTLQGSDVVFTPTDTPHSFRAVQVSLGWREAGLVEIRDGLAEGDQVVVNGSFLLKSQLLASEFGEEE